MSRLAMRVPGTRRAKENKPATARISFENDSGMSLRLKLRSGTLSEVGAQTQDAVTEEIAVTGFWQQACSPLQQACDIGALVPVTLVQSAFANTGLPTSISNAIKIVARRERIMGTRRGALTIIQPLDY